MTNFRILLGLLATFISLNSPAAITRGQLDHIFDTLLEIYTPQLPANEALYFNPPSIADFDWWDYDVWRGSYVGYEQEGIYHHNIYIMGGLAKADFVTMDGVAAIVCHEIGHGLGGEPLQREDRTSTEGQSDYFSTGECLKQFFLKSPRDISSDQLTPAVAALCQQRYTDEQELYLCLRTMNAINERVHKFATQGQPTSILTPTDEVATITNREAGVYPSFQCRVDIYVAANLGLPRPRCWYAD